VKQEPVLTRRVPSKTLTLADGREKRVVSVYDLVLANYGLDRGLEDSNAAEATTRSKPTPRLGRADHRRARVSD
jgi:nitrate reductase alpha subunit